MIHTSVLWLGTMFKARLISFFGFVVVTVLFSTVSAYNLPPLNLGYTSFLDGGVGPAMPGFVFQEYLQYYESNRFLDQNGKKIPGIKDPDFSAYVSLSQFLYTTKIEVLKGKLGFNCIVPCVFSTHLNKNLLQIKSSGGGFGDLLCCAYIQWDTVMRGDVPVFSSRIEMNVSLPTGKCREPQDAINPGAGFYYITPYWAGTLFFTPKLSASWRLHYLWCGRDKKTHIQAGQSVFSNYSLEYQVKENFYAGINGYFLEQFQNSKLNNKTIPNSRESLFSIGPGVLYLPSKNLNIFANFYFETYARNRPKGFRANLRAVKIF